MVKNTAKAIKIKTMIKYRLICKNCDSKFDSWFASSNEFERLKKKKLGKGYPLCGTIFDLY